MPLAIALDTLLALFKRYKSLFLIAPLLIALAVQTARIEGFLWWKGYKADRAAFRPSAPAGPRPTGSTARASTRC